jgi:hypothetical protein
MNGARLGHFCVLFLTLLCCTAGMLLACAANKIAVPSEVDGVEIKTIDPLEAFQKGYEAISEKVEKGCLPSEAMNRATAIRMGLEKYLIKAEAKLEILRLDVLHGAEAQRKAALSQIVELVEEREQTKLNYLQQLQALEGGSRTSEDKTGEKETGKDLNIEIKIAPENIGDGEWP